MKRATVIQLRLWQRQFFRTPHDQIHKTEAEAQNSVNMQILRVTTNVQNLGTTAYLTNFQAEAPLPVSAWHYAKNWLQKRFTQRVGIFTETYRDTPRHPV